ncbi:alpha/beta hydrolase [Planctomicrobium piriforme]|uniref:Serine aminopeptidase S33 domain-containing protein n=1 Tax=Planctomicrobium piriforme TaxID=1576369 RepID=A0A1I3JE92_9PLAN|nr:hypothetical protein [Planctomicrobium piriforme]SFI58587.1 hypothetical protein SAMN05421753_110148 [Planctomicrobium piriforme]
MSYWLLALLCVVGLLLALDAVIHFVYALAALRRIDNPPSFLVQSVREDAPQPDPVRFPTRDGLELRGGIYLPEESPRGVIVFCPETLGGHLTAMNYAESLLDAGFAIFSFNFRNQSPSDTMSGYRATHWMTNHEITDVHAALDLVLSQPQFSALPVGLMGVSRGACAALAAGAMRPEVEFIWAQGAFSTRAVIVHHAMNFLGTVVGRWGKMLPEWHVRITIGLMLLMAGARNGARFVRLESVLPRWRGRDVQFISGARDTYVPTQLTRRLTKLVGANAENSHWVASGAKHNLERVAKPDEYDHRLLAFFNQMPVPVPVSQPRVAVAH